MSLQSIALLVPVIAGLFWLLAYWIYAPRDIYFRKFKRFIALISCSFLFVSLSSDQDSKLMLHFVLFEQVCLLALVPCFISYIKSFKGAVSEGILFRLCSFLPFLHLVIGIESVYTCGFDNAVRIYLESFDFVGPMFPYLQDKPQIVFYACYTYVFRTFMLLNFLLFVVEMTSTLISEKNELAQSAGFLFAGKTSRLVPVQYLLAMVMFLVIVPVVAFGGDICSWRLLYAVIVSVLVAAALSAMALVGAAGPIDKQSLNGILETIRTGSLNK